MSRQRLRPWGGKSQLSLNNFSDQTNKANVRGHWRPWSPFNSCSMHEQPSGTHTHICVHKRTRRLLWITLNRLMISSMGQLGLFWDHLQPEAPQGPGEGLRGNYNANALFVFVCACVSGGDMCMSKIRLIYNQASFDYDGFQAVYRKKREIDRWVLKDKPFYTWV